MKGNEAVERAVGLCRMFVCNTNDTTGDYLGNKRIINLCVYTSHFRGKLSMLENVIFYK